MDAIEVVDLTLSDDDGQGERTPVDDDDGEKTQVGEEGEQSFKGEDTSSIWSLETEVNETLTHQISLVSGDCAPETRQHTPTAGSQVSTAPSAAVTPTHTGSVRQPTSPEGDDVAVGVSGDFPCDGRSGEMCGSTSSVIFNDGCATVMNIDGDGNCLYRAVLHQRLPPFRRRFERPTDVEVARLRGQVADYMREHRDDFADFFDASQSHTLDDSIRLVERDGEWGDGLSIRAIANLWSVNVEVYYEYGPLINVQPEEEPSPQPIRIAFRAGQDEEGNILNHNHFDSVLDVVLDRPASRTSLSPERAREASASPIRARGKCKTPPGRRPGCNRPSKRRRRPGSLSTASERAPSPSSNSGLTDVVDNRVPSPSPNSGLTDVVDTRVPSPCPNSGLTDVVDARVPSPSSNSGLTDVVDTRVPSPSSNSGLIDVVDARVPSPSPICGILDQSSDFDDAEPAAVNDSMEYSDLGRRIQNWLAQVEMNSRLELADEEEEEELEDTRTPRNRLRDVQTNIRFVYGEPTSEVFQPSETFTRAQPPVAPNVQRTISTNVVFSNGRLLGTFQVFSSLSK